MIRVLRNQFVTMLSPNSPAAVRVHLNEPFVVECPSAAGGVFDAGGQSDSPSASANPMGGPVAVDGVASGDYIAVDIRRIDAVGYGKSGDVLFKPVNGRLEFLDGLTVACEPSLGCIGVAPRLAQETTDNATCGSHGGNLDCRDIAAGAVVIFRARLDGGLISCGDAQLAMGDGELTGQGVESAVDAELAVRRASPIGLEWPLIIRNGEIMTMGANRDMRIAQRIAFEELITLGRIAFNLDRVEMNARIAVAGDLRVCQSCCAVVTVRLALPLALLPAPVYPLVETV